MTIRNRTFASIQEKSEATATTLTNIMDQIHLTAIEITEQSNLKKLAGAHTLMTPYEMAQNTIHLQEQQTSITNANHYIENFIIY